MAKQIWKCLDNLSPSEAKLANLPRKVDGLYNLKLNEYGQLEKRAGYSKYNTTSIGASHKIVGMHRFYTQANLKEFLVAWNTNIYKLSETTPWGATSIKSGLTADSDTYFADFLNHCYFVNGVDTPLKYNMTHVRSMGVAAPTTKPTGTAGGSGGSLGVGDYKYCYTYVDENGYESSASPVSDAITVASGEKVTLTITNSPDFKIITRRVYRTSVGGAIYYYDGEVDTGWTSTDWSGDFAGGWEHLVGTIETITLDGGGTGYSAGDIVTIVQSGGSLGTFTVDTVNWGGVIQTITLLNKGSGYSVANSLATDIGYTFGQSGSGATINITAINNTAVLEQSRAANIGTKYQVNYTITGRTAGSLTISYGGQNLANITASGVFEPTASTTGNLLITPTAAFNGKIIPSITSIIIVSTSFVSSQADNTLGTEVATDHTTPPSTAHLITKRRNKLYLADDEYLYPSHTSDVEYFPAAWRLRTGNSQKIKGLLEQLTALPVTTEDSIERLVGTDEDNFEFKNSYSTEGCVAMRSYVNCDNLIVYLGQNGINYFDGTTSGIFSKAVNEYIKDNINGTYRHLSCATYFDDKYMLCYPKGANTTPSETIWIDLKNKSYGVYSFDFSCFSIWDRGTDGLKLKGGSNTIGRVYSIFDGLEDDGSAITAYDDIEPLDMGTPEKYKQWYSVFIKIKSTTATQLTMYYTLDNNSETSANRVMNGTDIVFVDGGSGADTITTTAGNFLGEGFKANDIITVSSSDSNNKNFTIVSLTATTITLATGQVTAEAAGVAVLTAPLTLEANTTKWYRISLGSGGKRARAFKPRPYVSDKYALEIHGLMICYEDETFAEEKE